MKRIFGLTAFLLTLTLLPVQAQEKTVILGGDTIAITVNYEGVYVSGMYDFQVNGETLSAAKEGTVQVGDRIIESNGRTVSTLEELFANLKTLQKERHPQWAAGSGFIVCLLSGSRKGIQDGIVCEG